MAYLCLMDASGPICRQCCAFRCVWGFSVGGSLDKGVHLFDGYDVVGPWEGSEGGK